MKFSRSRKGDLSLSMNAIVILILAITLLGLGLTFMRGLFKTMETKVNEAVSAQELVNPPTNDNQFTVAPAEITLKTGQPGKTILAFLNTDPATSVSCGLAMSTGVSCQSSDSQCTSSVPGVTYSTNQVTMTKDRINAWTVAISSPSTTGWVNPSCTYLCTATMACGTNTWTKDFIVTYTQ
jgi:hypothetical protein